MMARGKCPSCGSDGYKIIAGGLPIKLCMDTTCNTIWGFWSNVYVWILAPIDCFIKRRFSFMIYKGSYLKALRTWIGGVE